MVNCAPQWKGHFREDSDRVPVLPPALSTRRIVCLEPLGAVTLPRCPGSIVAATAPAREHFITRSATRSVPLLLSVPTHPLARSLRRPLLGKWVFLHDGSNGTRSAQMGRRVVRDESFVVVACVVCRALPEFLQMWVGPPWECQEFGDRPSSAQSFLSLGQSRLAACWTLLDGVMMPKGFRAASLVHPLGRDNLLGPSPEAGGRLHWMSMLETCIQPGS